MHKKSTGFAGALLGKHLIEMLQIVCVFIYLYVYLWIKYHTNACLSPRPSSCMLRVKAANGETIAAGVPSVSRCFPGRRPESMQLLFPLASMWVSWCCR